MCLQVLDTGDPSESLSWNCLNLVFTEVSAEREEKDKRMRDRQGEREKERERGTEEVALVEVYRALKIGVK